MDRWLPQVSNILYIRQIIWLDEEIFTCLFYLHANGTGIAG